jgi:hypothetical protein
MENTTKNTKDYFSSLLVGAEDWAIDQVRDDHNKLELEWFHSKVELLNLKKLVGELIDMLEQTEFSDSENPFHPTVIRSCRVQHTMKLDEIMPKITKIVKNP